MFRLNTKPDLIGSRVVLRAACAADVDARIALGHSDQVTEDFGEQTGVGPGLERKHAQAWIERQMRHPRAWMITSADDLIGVIRFDDLRAEDRRVSLAMAVFDPGQHDKGYGTEALGLALQHGFSKLHLHRVEARVLATNARAIAVYERFGFVSEGRLRESAKVSAGWTDEIMMALLASEFTQ